MNIDWDSSIRNVGSGWCGGREDCAVEDRSRLIGTIRVTEIHLGSKWIIVCKPFVAKLRRRKKP